MKTDVSFLACPQGAQCRVTTSAATALGSSQRRPRYQRKRDNYPAITIGNGHGVRFDRKSASRNFSYGTAVAKRPDLRCQSAAKWSLWATMFRRQHFHQAPRPEADRTNGATMGCDDTNARWGPRLVGCPICGARLTFCRTKNAHIDQCGFESYRLACDKCGAQLSGIVDPNDDELLLSRSDHER